MSFRKKFILLSSLLCILLIAETYFATINQSFLTLSLLMIISLIGFVALVDTLLSKELHQPKNLTPKTPENAQISEPTSDIERKNFNLDNLRDSSNQTNEVEGSEARGEYDQLTALPTYQFCLQILAKTILQAKRHNKIFAVLVLDLDNFHKINFNLGRNFSDQVLKQIGNRIVNTLRAEDTIARYSNNKFIIILNDISKPKFAASAAFKLLSAISLPIRLDAPDVIQTDASIGICIYPQDGADLTLLLKNAESALHRAQKSGGNAYEFFSQELDSEAHEFINIGQGLRKALLNNELTLHYQPKLHIKQGQIIGVEALMRWQHPYHGILAPSKFISVAEETGFIAELSEWALREACKANKHWQDEGYTHITVAFNLSAKEFYLPDIEQRIHNILKETGLNPKYLELEINEATAMQDIQLAIEQMQKIKNIGVQISLDHFGIGYTALSYLKLFPINTIKIDRAFIKGIPNQPNDCAITNALIALTHQLGYNVIAEGVETAEQLTYLSEHHCDMVQGYYLGHPVSEQKIINQLPKLPEKVII